MAKPVDERTPVEVSVNGPGQAGPAAAAALDADIIIANAPDPVFVSDLEGKILQANDAVSELLGFRRDEVLEQSLSRFISEEETREFTAALREVVEHGVTRNAVLNPRSATGEVIPTSLNASALRDADGNVIGAIGVLRDMRELDKARAYAESLIENAPDPVFVSDLEGKILQTNEAVSQLLGFRRDEVVEQSLSRFISEEETREFTAALKEVVERGVTRDAVLNPRSATGEVIPTTLNASALRDTEGNVIGAIGVLRDMRELDKARAYAESLIENAPDPVFVSDLEGKILTANEAVSELLGFRRDEVLEQSLSRFISEEETREFTAALREVVERGVTRDARLNPRSATGEVIPTTLNASALRDTEGNVIGAIGVLRDMRELDKARAYAESLIENAPDPVFVSDLEGKILTANEAVSQLLGFRRDEVVEQSLSRFISAEETREFTAALREVVERGVTRNARLNPRAATGEVIPTTLNASALRDTEGNVIGAIGVLRDMRAYEQVVRDLEESKTELQEKILDLEKFEEVVVGRELKMIALEKELDSLRQELVTLPALERVRVEAVPPLDDGEAEASLRQRVADLEHRVAQAEERRRALLHIMGDLNDTNKRLADQRKAMLHILGDYEQDRSRLAKQTERLDNSRRALLHILSDSHDSNLRLESSRKAMIHIMGDLRETTAEIERRELELREKQEQLIQAGKLATLGELTTGIAHELNNPLNNIGLFVGNAIDRIELGSVEPDAISDELGKAMDQVRKATEIITHLRTFGRAATIVYEPVDLVAVIERSISLLFEQLRLRQIEVAVEPGEEPIVVDGNAIQLEQVFVNLLTNARDALADVELKRISITCERRPPAAVIIVADTGPGVTAEVEQRIFDPFFTTKEVGAGTGLGLSITYGIVTEHEGTISVGNGDDGGAVFTIELPLAEPGAVVEA